MKTAKKKQKVKLIGFIIVPAFVLLGVFVLVHGKLHLANGDATTDALQSQKDAVQQKLNDINSRIQSYQSQISTVEKQANTLSNQIALLDLQITSTQAQIEQTQAQIDAANLEIADVTGKIATTEEQIAKQKNVLRDLIAQINDMDQRSPLEIALENDNFTEFLNDLQFTTSIQERSQEALTQIKALKVDLEARQAQLQKQKDQLSQLNSQLNAQKLGLDTQRGQKQTLLTQTKGKESNYKKLLATSEADQKALNDEINNLDNQIAAKLGNHLLTPHKGMLGWPMQGTLTQGYGNTGFTSLGYSFHNGLDIAAPPGTPIHAAAAGTVVGTGSTTSSGIDGAYGNWVAIKHDTGVFASHPIITLYGHMSSFVLRKGQTVKDGDLVGFEGNTGNTTRILYGPERGFHLHFTVFDAQGFVVAGGAHQDKYGAYQVPAGAPYNPLNFL
jgi:murein DD-endopeptidase MepM/ murein hydrolase activator NlpD